MNNNNIGSVVIVENQRAIAIFTERDLVRCIANHEDKALSMKAIECGSSDLLIFDKHDCILEALTLFAKWGVRHAPVVDDKGVVVGVVALKDIASELMEDPDILMDLVSLSAPEISKDLIYLIIKDMKLRKM